ncbi:NAD-dependent epimerase/dehydratase family protein [Consotaella aegiceratis]|uniref:NAD-dependent epimerase/dehydratase family protein n=1 Tax=Consotaella aegiceratis TaxID=3097961 RepID=UPI002F404213
MPKIVITGGLGLIGSRLKELLHHQGNEVVIVDLAAPTSSNDWGDICDLNTLVDRFRRCDGIVHLAAVSRVIWGERDPAQCWAVNVEGTRNVLNAARLANQGRQPWIVYASSREVYGHAVVQPVSETAPLVPVNVYGRSKVAAELLFKEAAINGMRTSIVRFSNVFGSTSDHPDRVVPAFSRAAAKGGTIVIEGAENTFDFTWQDDVCSGVATLCAALADESTRGLPPIHFVSGQQTSLAQLSKLALSHASPGTTVKQGAPRNFDVARFCGDPARAAALLGWRAQMPLERGVAALIEKYRAAESR